MPDLPGIDPDTIERVLSGGLVVELPIPPDLLARCLAFVEGTYLELPAGATIVPLPGRVVRICRVSSDA